VPTQSGRDPKVANHLPSSRRFLPLPTTHNAQLKPFFRRLLPLPKTQVSSRKSLRAFTLVELIIVMSILIILFNLLMVPMMMGLKLTSSTRQAVEAQDDARMALELMKKDMARAMYVLPDGPWQTTSLKTALSSTEATTMTVANAANFPDSGLVAVGLVPFGYELIAYTSHTNTTLDGLTRGQGGTTPLDHPLSARVLLVSWPDPTSLQSNVTWNATTSMSVLDASNFPDSGVVVAGTAGTEPADPYHTVIPGYELVKYGSHTNTTLDGLIRGWGGTKPINHDAPARVSLFGGPEPDTFVTSRLDLIMPKTDSEGKAIQPLTPDPKMVRYYVAPVRNSTVMFAVPPTTLQAPLSAGETATMGVADAREFPPAGFVAVGTLTANCELIAYTSHTNTTLNGLKRGQGGTTAIAHSTSEPVVLTEGWPKYWNPFQLPTVGVPPVRGGVARLYVLYRVVIDLDGLKNNDPVYELYGSDPWRPDFFDDPNLSPVKFSPTQDASYSFWWRRKSTALTPVESADLALYVHSKGLTAPSELRPLEVVLPSGDRVAAPGFAAVPIRKEKEQLIPNDRSNPTKYFASLPLWSEWPRPSVTLSNGNPDSSDEFWTIDLTTGALDFAIPRTEFFDGDGTGTPSGDGDLIQDPDSVGATNVYDVSLNSNTLYSSLDRDADGINDFVIIPGSETIQVIDSSGNILDYTRADSADIEENHYFIDYEAGRITFTSGFNGTSPTSDVIIRFQYRRNLLREESGVTLVKKSGSDDNVIAFYSSLACIDVQLVLASYSNSRVPSDEFRLASRLELGNAPR